MREFGFSGGQAARAEHVGDQVGAGFFGQSAGSGERHIAMNADKDVLQRRGVEFPKKLAAAERGGFDDVAFKIVAMAFRAFCVIEDVSAFGLLFGVDAVPNGSGFFFGQQRER